MTIYAYTDERSPGTRRHQFTLEGRVRDAIRASMLIQYAGADRLLEGQPAPERTVRVTTLAPLSELRAESATPDIEARASRSADDANWYVTVAPTDCVPVGEFIGEVRLHPVTVAGDKLPSIPINVQGCKEPDIALMPSRAQFVAVHAGSANRRGSGPEAGSFAKETVTIWSRSGRPFSVEGVDADGLSIDPPASDTAARHEFTLRAMPTGPGSSTRDVTFSLCIDGERGKIVLPVSVYETAATKHPVTRN